MWEGQYAYWLLKNQHTKQNLLNNPQQLSLLRIKKATLWEKIAKVQETRKFGQWSKVINQTILIVLFYKCCVQFPQ